jgi:hypothetical protein
VINNQHAPIRTRRVVADPAADVDFQDRPPSARHGVVCSGKLDKLLHNRVNAFGLDALG